MIEKIFITKSKTKNIRQLNQTALKSCNAILCLERILKIITSLEKNMYDTIIKLTILQNNNCLVIFALMEVMSGISSIIFNSVSL